MSGVFRGKSGKRAAGFTLLELLVALAVFSVVAVLAYRGLDAVLQSRAAVEREMDRLAALQSTYNRMRRDLEQYIKRPIRDAWGNTQAALLGDAHQIEFTRGGRRNPLVEKRSDMQRVAYFMRDGALLRRYWRVLDRAPDSEALDTILLPELNAFNITYLDAALQAHQVWPPPNRPAEAAPRAVEIRLETPYWGEIIWLFASGM